MYRRYVKRMLDIIFSTMLIVLLLPLMVIIGALIRIDSSGGAIFKQKRMGRNAKEFTCYKFRTMKKEAPHGIPAKDLADPERYVTRVGRFLRRSSLDELPQLFNVFLGNMSIVGPRPLICEEKEIHRLRGEAGIYTLRPGITGLAQINGRNLLCDSEKIENDRIYLDNLKIRLDAKILFLTLGCVIGGKGIVGKNTKK
ncbi:MAG: sugar transferase [Clostridia bacterium]|nr:sugar transferase [Clostridia bacterium]